LDSSRRIEELLLSNPTPKGKGILGDNDIGTIGLAGHGKCWFAWEDSNLRPLAQEA